MKRTINKTEYDNKNSLKINKQNNLKKKEKINDKKEVKNKNLNQQNKKIVLDDNINLQSNEIYNQHNLNITDNEDLNESFELDNFDDLNNNKNNSANSSNPNEKTQINLDEVFKIFEKLFNEQIQEQLVQQKQQNIIHIQTENVMEIFEYQLKKQLIDIMNNESSKKNEENSEEETIEKLNKILISLENEPDFIKISDEEFKTELEQIPTQEDFNCFCAQMDYEIKLTSINSEDYEKLYTIMYTIGNYCYEPKKNLKRIILSIIKFDILRNKIVDNIQKTNKEENKNYTFDCITADMLFMNLRHFIPRDLMKTISRNIAYYFSKIY
jgi:hypothetical protein